MNSLSKKGVLFLTAGFHQPYTFQNIARLIEHEIDGNKEICMKIILSDGEIYISGLYQVKTKEDMDKCNRITEFDLLKVYATYEGASRPISISSLQILSQGHKGIYGFPPISMKDYLEAKIARQENPLESTEYKPIEPSFSHKDKNNIQSFSNLHNGEQFDMSECGPKNSQSLNQLENQQKRQSSFQISFDQQGQYELLNETIFSQTKKREARMDISQEIQTVPQKRLKPNEEQKEDGEIFVGVTGKHFVQNQDGDNLRKLQLQSQAIYRKDQPEAKNHLTVQQPVISQSQNPTQTKVIQIDVIDLDDMSTQKEKITLYPNSNKREYRKSHLKFIQEILQSDQKSHKEKDQQITEIQQVDSITIPRSQTLPSNALITPIKPHPMNNNSSSSQLSQPIMGSTTQRKKLRQQYNLLISNLYQSNSSFKIICRVNYIYEWKSKNGFPCLALELMDSEGEEIKAIVYMNHLTKDCIQCRQMVEVGRVYCFQNGECKRDMVQKEALQLVFNLRGKPCWGNAIQCGGRNKITLASKIKIEPFFQHRLLSISKLVETFESGRNNVTSVYGILQSFKVNEFEKKINHQNGINDADENKSDAEIDFTELPGQNKQKSTKKTSQKASSDGGTNIYLNGLLCDPIEKKKIFFSVFVSKPLSQNSLSTQNFLQRNLIKKGNLILLHNIKIHTTSNNTVKKLQKTKRTYLQVVTLQKSPWQYHRDQFGAQLVLLSPQNQTLYPTFKQMLSFTPKQIDSIMTNPRVINYSQQPYTQRSIYQMNQLLQESMLPEESCYSELKDVKIHAVEQRANVEICFYCKKKAKSTQLSSSIANKSIKQCTRCKMIVKTITMYVFNVVFADNTASFFVEVVKDQYLEVMLGMKVGEFVKMEEKDRKNHLEMIKYTDFSLKLRSEKKVGGTTHKINSIEKVMVKPRIDQIKTERKGVPKHYKRLETSW